MIDRLENKINKHIESYDIDFEKQKHIIIFKDNTSILVPLYYSTFVSKEEAIVIAINKKLDIKKKDEEQSN